MSLQTWQETLITAPAAGTLFNTYTTAKTVLPAGCLVTFPANYFYVGRMLRIDVQGAISNIVTTPGTMAFQVMLGSVIAFTTGNIQLNATAHTTLPFELQVYLTCRAVGTSTSANFMGQGWLTGIMFTNTAAQTDAVNTTGRFPAPATAPAVGTGWDSTAAQTLDFFVGFSISGAGNGVQIHQYAVEALN